MNTYFVTCYYATTDGFTRLETTIEAENGKAAISKASRQFNTGITLHSAEASKIS
jgi:predicted alternative tryptophan synthase beta-subunit